MNTNPFFISILLLHILTCLTSETDYQYEPPASESPSKLKVGIVGAGVAGLYAALILQSVGVDVEVLEAKARVGGRLYTYNFFPNSDPNTCQGQAYFEAGGMRFPNSWLFRREFRRKPNGLIYYLNKRLHPRMRLKVIEYLTTSDNNFYYINGRRAFVSQIQRQKEDLFHIGKSKGGLIPDEFAKRDLLGLRYEILEPFVDAIAEDYFKGLQYLHSFDNFTFRDYANSGDNPVPPQVWDFSPIGPFTRLGLTEVARLYIPSSVRTANWRAINGGSSKIPEAMAELLKGKVLLNKEVIAIFPMNNSTLKVMTKDADYNYDHVILTPTIGGLRKIDLSRCNLNFAKRKAMDAFHHLNVVKVGLLFKKRWWQDPHIMRGKPIFGGESFTDLPIGTVVFPSYGLNCTNYPAALLSSYTLEDQAFRMDKLSDNKIVNLVLDNLSEIFNLNVRKFYAKKFYIQRWGSDPHTMGAIRSLDSGQLTTYLKGMLTSEANGRLHLGGEAIGIFTAWSHDALTNGYHAVNRVLEAAKLYNEASEVSDIWGLLEDNWSFLDKM